MKRFGGRPGVREPEGIDAALARPEQPRAYGEGSVGLHACAAAIAAGFCRIRHPFVDGNKPIAFAASVYTLFLDGLDRGVTEAEATAKVLDLSAGSLSEADFAAWPRANSLPLADDL